MRIKQLIALVLFALASTLTLSAQQSNSNLKEVNVHQFKVKNVTADVIQAFKKDDSILHVVVEGSLVKLFTEPNYDQGSVTGLLPNSVSRTTDIVWISSKRADRNAKLFSK